MATSRPFTYNPNPQIPGTEKFGDLTVGFPTYGFESTGLQWWNGPDEELGYVIAQTNVDNNVNPLQPTQIPNVYGSVGFFRTDGKNTTAFINLTNAVSGQNFTTATQCKTWLESNNRWTSWSDFATEAIVAFKTRVLSSSGNFEAETNLENQLNTLGSTLFDSASLIITPNAYKEGVLFAVKPDKVGTNLLLQSEGFTLSPWGLLAEPLITRTANAGTSPIGTNNATLLTSNTDLHSRGIRQVVTLSQGVQYVFSVWARSDNGARIQLDISDNGNTFFNLTTEWQRIQITGQYWVPYGATMQFVDITFAANQLGKTCLIWGAQLEIGTTAGTYIPTTTRQGINETIGDLAVTRATTATLVNEQGLIEPVPYNLFSYSEDFGNSFWTKNNSTVTTNTNQTMSPIGTNTVDLYVPNTTFTEHPIISFFSSSNSSLYINSANTYNWSIYVKSAGNNFFLLRVNINGTWSSVVFNLSSSSIVSTHPNFISANIENVGNGWRLLSCVFTGVNGQNVFQHISSPTGNITFSGDGTSGAYIWGAQLTLGTSKREYFATTDRLNVARIDYSNGSPAILVEPQRTNLITQSNTLSSWSITNLIMESVSTDNPFGLNKVTRFTENNIDGVHQALTFHTINPQAVISFSFYVKSAGINSFTFGGNWDFLTSFNLTTGVFSGPSVSKYRSINMGNGWWRVIFTDLVPDTNFRSYVIRLSSSGAREGLGIFVYGAQLEVGANATSYIPTVASTVTRNADVISKSGISSLIGQTEGTIFIETTPLQMLLSDGVTRSLFSINENSLSLNLFYLRRINNSYILSVNASGISFGGPTVFTYSNINLNKLKIAIKYGLNTLKVFVNGVNTFNTTNFSVPTTNTLTLGNNRLNGDILDGRIDLFQLYKTQLTDQQCIELTTL